MMTRSQSAAAQAEADNADNSNAENSNHTYEAWDKQGFEMQRLEPSGTIFPNFFLTILILIYNK